MKKLIINGGSPLFGTVRVGGSKNAALPILFASLATEGTTEIIGVPDIGDTAASLDILRSFGVKVQKENEKLILDTRVAKYTVPDATLVRRIRASTYLIGACLSRFGRCQLLDFGGCNFADRPIDLHLYAASMLGARSFREELYADRLVGTRIVLPKPSVGATVNALIMASRAEGVTMIEGFAREPHVLLLIDYLRSCGADVTVGDSSLTVTGTRLHGGKIKIIGDMIEAGTYLTAGLITDGEVEVIGIDHQAMEPYISLVSSMGALVELKDEGIRAKRGLRLGYAEITAEPYPGFPTDLQPIVAPLFSLNSGGRIIDNVFPERFGYLDVLSSFGVRYNKGKGMAEVMRSEIRPARVAAPCLRGGAACLLTALCASGESWIESPDLLLRGYEEPVAKLRSLGAKIEMK